MLLLRDRGLLKWTLLPLRAFVSDMSLPTLLLVLLALLLALEVAKSLSGPPQPLSLLGPAPPAALARAMIAADTQGPAVIPKLRPLSDLKPARWPWPEELTRSEPG